MKYELAYDEKVVFNIAELKSIKVLSDNAENINDRHYFLTFELKTRVEYILNPNTKQYEKEYFNDIIQVEFNDYEMAQAYRRDWIAMWDEFLDKNDELLLEEDD